MKILVISNLYPPNVFGGAEVLTHALVGELRKRHQVMVLTAQGALAHEPDVLPLLHLSKRYPLPLDHNFVDLLRLACVSPGNYLTTRRVIRRWNPDVVLVSDLKRLGFGPLFAAQSLRPTAAFVHDLHSFNIGHERPGWRAPLRRAFGRMIFYGPIEVRFALANSANTMRLQHPQIVFSNSRVVGVGIHPPEDLEKIVADHPKSRGPGPVLVHVGRIEPAKGVHDIIDAASILAADPEFRHLEVQIIGFENDPGYRAELVELARRRNLSAHVRFLGRVSESEKYARLAAADAMIFASHWDEGHGQTYLEAMLCGTPCVCVPAGGAREVLRDGENCLTFHAGDIEALSQACFRLLRDSALRDRITANAKSMVLEKFTAEAFGRRCEQVLFECAAEWRHGAASPSCELARMG